MPDAAVFPNALMLAGVDTPLLLPDYPAELVMLPAITGEVVYTPGNLQIILSAVDHWARSEAEKADSKTTKGRAALVSTVAKIASTKVGLDRLGLELTEGWRRRTATVNADRKRVTTSLTALQHAIRQPVTDWEEADAARMQAHRDAVAIINGLTEFAHCDPSAAEVAARLTQAQDLGTRAWEEFAESAANASADAVNRLLAMHAAAVTHEAERAELERLRAGAEERLRQDEERQRAERKTADAKAEQDCLDAEKRLRDAMEDAARAKATAKADAEKAEADRIAAAEQAKVDAEAAVEKERQRVAALAAKARDDADAREADGRHRAAVNNAVVKVLMDETGCGREVAKAVVRVIASGRTKPHCSMFY